MPDDLEHLTEALDRLKAAIDRNAGPTDGAAWLMEASLVVFKLRCRAERYALDDPDNPLLAAFRRALSEPKL